jgi:hypothetical protein
MTLDGGNVLQKVFALSNVASDQPTEAGLTGVQEAAGKTEA